MTTWCGRQTAGGIGAAAFHRRFRSIKKKKFAPIVLPSIQTNTQREKINAAAVASAGFDAMG